MLGPLYSLSTIVEIVEVVTTRRPMSHADGGEVRRIYVRRGDYSKSEPGLAAKGKEDGNGCARARTRARSHCLAAEHAHWAVDRATLMTRYITPGATCSLSRKRIAY